MTPVELRIPASLLHRFLALAAELIGTPVDVDSGPLRRARLQSALTVAAAEFVLAHADAEPVLAPPASLIPTMTTCSAVPAEAARFVRAMARSSGISAEDCWHLVVLEFCEREASPGLVTTSASDRAA